MWFYLGIDYKNADLWKNEFPECNGTRQSPIDIDLTSSKMFIPRSLKLKNYNGLPTAMKLTNDGNVGMCKVFEFFIFMIFKIGNFWNFYILENIFDSP